MDVFVHETVLCAFLCIKSNITDHLSDDIVHPIIFRLNLKILVHVICGQPFSYISTNSIVVVTESLFIASHY